MTPSEPLVIRKVGNGYIVETWQPNVRVVADSEVKVFNDMGYASSTGDAASRPCLLKFIEEHFGGQT